MSSRKRREFLKKVFKGGAGVIFSGFAFPSSTAPIAGFLFSSAAPAVSPTGITSSSAATSSAGTSSAATSSGHPSSGHPSSGHHCSETFRESDKSVIFSGREAMFYRKTGNNEVQCQLCPQGCHIFDGNSGFCRVRKNIGGALYSMVYGRPCTFDVGPIEKAPLYHFIPGHKRLCVATVGCNLRCKYCHNWHISQRGPGEVREFSMSPEQIVQESLQQGVTSVSFTYNEPTVFYEYMYDISRLASSKGLKVHIVSNGYINPEPLRKLLTWLDAVKIDLKAFSEDFYSEISAARLKPVMKTLKVLKEERMFFEIVNLVVPTLNDNPYDIRRMCEWISDNLGDEVPLHFSRFSPTYRLTNLPSTPVRTLEEAVRIAHGSGLKYVYIGNMPGHRHNSTWCPGCGERLIHRTHISVIEISMKNGSCMKCGYRIEGIWD